MKDLRLAALRRFAAAISILTILGHAFLGFEQAYAHVAVALATAYSLELGLEVIEALACQRPLAIRGGAMAVVDFLLPAHITGLACAMLLYPNERLAPIAFAVSVGIGSKAVLRAPNGRGWRHFLNPSNTGIAATLLLFPWVGIAPPYQFTENLSGWADGLLPLLIVCTGTFINGRLTGRLPLIAAWLGGFVAQAAVRSAVFATPFGAALGPMTGVAFVLFTFYMITDPATTPTRWRGQLAFGAAVALAYGVLQTVHVVYGLFFALAAVCALRGAWLLALAAARVHHRAPDGVMKALET